jgi:iron complex outermembrane receptor protein
LFYADYTNLQFRAGTVGTASFVGNAGAAEVKGIEIELLAQLDKNTRVFTNYSYQYSQFNELNIKGQDLAGNVLPLTPKHSLTAGIEYSHQIGGNLKMVLTGDFLYKSKAYFDPSNFEESVQEVNGVVNGSLSFASLDDGMRLTFFVKNLTNEIYVTRANRLGVFLGKVDFSQSVPFSQVVAGTFSSPRTYGASLSYEF